MDVSVLRQKNIPQKMRERRCKTVREGGFMDMVFVCYAWYALFGRI